MIIVKIIGGLGNQLFQYSFGRVIENKLGVEVFYDISDFKNYNLRKLDLQHFDFELKIANEKQIQQAKSFKNKLIFKFFKGLNIHKSNIHKLSFYQEYITDYHDTIFNLSEDIYLDGYWQSEKYFYNHKNLIRNQLIIKTPVSIDNQVVLDKIRNTNSVSVHIRRGDYVSNDLAFKLYGVCSLEYYNKSLDYINNRIEDPIFYIFSDDIEWAKINLINSHSKIFVDLNNADTAYEDLRLMSSCKHNIIANSSFSWWGAWLNSNVDKIVIAPELWFADSNMNAKDILPVGWVQI
jgi:hypothetical protein